MARKVSEFERSLRKRKRRWAANEKAYRKLVAKYGLLSEQDPTKPYCDFLSDIPLGWFDLIETLVQKLIAAGWDRQVAQVKQKWGGLRFYVGGASPAMARLIARAEKRSLKICEEYGRPGVLCNADFVRTLCDAHAEGLAPLRKSPVIRIRFQDGDTHPAGSNLRPPDL